MSDWELTAGLQNLRDQANAVFPARDKASDGTISDAAHRAESRTGHSPDDTPGSNPEWDGDLDSKPEVRAWDMDSDLRTPGVTAQQLVEHICALPGISAVLRYIIFNRKIYRASNGWKAEAYTGASAHTEHIHFSGAHSQAADNNTTCDFHLEDLVALTDADITKLAVAAAKATWGYPLEDPRTKQAKSAAVWQRYNDVVSDAAANKVIAAVTRVIAALPQVDTEGLVAALAPALAQAVVAALPEDRDDITPAELQDAIVGALAGLVARA